MLIGYARVSTEDQKLRLQRDALDAAGCEKVFREKVSGAARQLPMREKMLNFARDGEREIADQPSPALQPPENVHRRKFPGHSLFGHSLFHATRRGMIR